MRASKYLLALWTAVAVYALVSLCAGSMGLPAYGELLAEKEKQERNLEKLGLINEELENAKNALLYDRDTIAVYARELGFGEKTEKFVRIVGFTGNRKPHTFPGDVVIAAKPVFMQDRIIRLISIFAGFAVCAAFLVSDLLEYKTEKMIN
ncbi:MAG: septum formation initiator family protein [Treponema sp.]|jgi:cell division protein FtsB|nr:septum formation initiator family protein [Treponema sp.]